MKFGKVAEHLEAVSPKPRGGFCVRVVVVVVVVACGLYWLRFATLRATESVWHAYQLNVAQADKLRVKGS